MAVKINWERLSVLVVEDNSFVRFILSNTIKALGVVNVVAVADGKAAIELIEEIKTSPERAGLSTIDIILSDFYMPEIDGAMLLRWIRTSPKSFNRFVPFVMVSGAADPEVVSLSRDLGVTSFLAKPFSPSTIGEKLIQIIESQPVFVLTDSYLGPNRRRRRTEVAEERRTAKPEEIQQIEGETDQTKPRRNYKAAYIRLPNRLRDKLIAPGEKGNLELDEEFLTRAQASIDGMEQRYTDWVEESMETLSEALAAIARGDRGTSDHVATINRLAHELRGQSGIFDYPLITGVGKSLYLATVNPDMSVPESQLKLFGAHIDTIRAVLRNKIKGDGGDIGLALLKEIEAAAKHFA